MNKNMKQTLTTLLTVVLLGSFLTGCGKPASSTPNRPAKSYAPQQTLYITDSNKTGTKQQPNHTEPVPESTTPKVDSATMSAQPSEKPSALAEQAPAKRFGSIEAIKELRTLVGSWTDAGGCPGKYQVWLEQADIPCGLVWEYLPAEGAATDDRLENLYQAHVDVCDWSLVFDVEFYKKAFPMLALQYDYDDGLLTQHFQTVGVHEGRQGSESFNVSAYMANCDEFVRKAFGSSYECYYFYYMLNQDTQKSVDARNDGSHPAWMEVQLSKYQEDELDAVNEYREDAGVAPVAADPELMALASWRAWHDAGTGTKAHDWMTQNRTTLRGYMELMDVYEYAENTTKVGNARDNRYQAFCQAAFYYKNSQSHYEAMVDPQYLCFGCSDLYFSDEHTMLAQFDLFTDGPSVSPCLGK